MNHILEQDLDNLYQYLLLSTLTKVYVAKKQNSSNTEIDEFSNLFLDKFGIHSASFFHLSKGIIELKKSNETVKMKGYDLFSVNSLFRVMMENYAVFSNLFVEPKSIEEKEFRFYLWKIDGLFDKSNLIISSDNHNIKKVLLEDKEILDDAILILEKNEFYKSLDNDELIKIYKPDKRKTNWRFLYNDNKITPLTISGLIKHTCKTEAFINQYRYSSIHTHSNYLSLEHFKATRGIPISDDYVNLNTKLAIYLTCLLIFDICSICPYSKKAFEREENSIVEYVNGIASAIKNYL